MKNFLRGFIALWYLLGWISHVYLGLFSPATYRAFGNTALFPFIKTLWQNWIFPHITLCALILAVFEIAVGLMLIDRGKWVKYGLALSVAFNLCLVLLGLGSSATSFGNDLLMNRLPNLIFIVLQIPLFWATFEVSIADLIKSKLSKKSA
jgi:hypothetical protein